MNIQERECRFCDINESSPNVSTASRCSPSLSLFLPHRLSLSLSFSLFTPFPLFLLLSVSPSASFSLYTSLSFFLSVFFSCFLSSLRLSYRDTFSLFFFSFFFPLCVGRVWNRMILHEDERVMSDRGGRTNEKAGRREVSVRLRGRKL